MRSETRSNPLRYSLMLWKLNCILSMRSGRGKGYVWLLNLGAAADFTPGTSMEEMLKQAETVGLKSYPGNDPDILSRHGFMIPIEQDDVHYDFADVRYRE